MAHQIVAQLPPHPRCFRSVCAKCFLATHAPFVNLGIEADLGETAFYADLYICSACITEMGRDLGMLTPDQADALKVRAADADARATALSAELIQFKALDEMVRAHAAQPVTDVLVPVVPKAQRQKPVVAQ